ncbi:V-set domain-containing T-cell activation inhibitor 1 [Centropristis striata]|uniref:V-set domain-containing T-cell activation inhibitor 1 n=1 Tax=Centropristis striata TaxID=184440 RepID=UPI0027DF4AE4|nr:V-set domain-containing T-cell activation inhibitor 1 [Centropristis striata]
MATLGQIIFYSMIALIVLFAAAIILILSLSLSGSKSEVTSSNAFPIANLGEDKLLSCLLNTATLSTRLQDVSVTWWKEDLSGLVYKYQNGVPDLADQNSQFKGRTQLFPDSLGAGNASLMLRSVRSSDEGQYTCSISSSDGGGTVNIHLRTAAFTAPAFKFSNGVLAAEASRWFPKPSVTWSNFYGEVLTGNTSFTAISGGIYSVVSTLLSVNVSDTYNCRIENDFVSAVSRAIPTGSGVSGSTYFMFSAASSLLASSYLSIVTAVLCSFYLT